uniref:Reverse transcriptase domain-containing protein n=1 Tax=Cajanus cajan TaxID=3821 RepID=A0A151TA59_CAJCA|nr:hypothetical protein KK1_018514 [Cajanus cajan]
MKELRPIALCNVIYKILSKALANRLKPLLQKKWVSWMMMCITSVHFQVLLNGNRVGSIVPGRGLRQGDPLSPYLFILGMEGLSSLIYKAERLGNMHGIQICRGAPKLHHLMFADDVFLFFQASEKETNEVATILKTFEVASGQAINYDKSEVFLNRHAPPTTHIMLSNTLHVQKCVTTGKYLGLPSMIGRNKNEVFRFIKERILKKL